ncbi:tight adherence protein B [Nitrosomonas ureae]|uniref:Tight adherence protein B n=1 Tax=Nitrosomonas ureae TaxID=44577 RepID=A0A285BZ05_9PROT|nr:type II secretion system F family protein [Nitrosomonas ureae]SNX60126.1 tight adherence protein B [Nitrosomonas ureae]
MDYSYYLFIALVFVAIVLFLEGLYLTWNAYKGPEAVRIEKRLQTISAGWQDATERNLIKQRLLSDSPTLERLLLQIPRIHSLDRLLIQSGMELSVTGFLGYTCMTVLGGMAIALLLNLHFLILLLCAIVAGLFPVLLVLSARHKRLLKIEEQLPDAMDLMARALKAGHAFSGALQMVSSEGAEPIAGEFSTTFEEVNYGISMQEALMNLSMRVPSTDLRYLVIAVLIQRESGGNLAELLESISSLIRARLKLLGTIRVLSAEGRLSAWILGCLPFALALLIHLANPEYLNLLFTDPVGHQLLGGSLTMMVIGIFAMWRIIKIRV